MNLKIGDRVQRKPGFSKGGLRGTVINILDWEDGHQEIGVRYDNGEEYNDGMYADRFILLDNETVSVVFNLLANLVLRFNKLVSVNSINTDKSAETTPVVVIGFGLTVIPVPAEIEVKLPDPPPLSAPPPRGKIIV